MFEERGRERGREKREGEVKGKEFVAGSDDKFYRQWKGFLNEGDNDNWIEDRRYF